jgi:hypothetical protein
VTNTGPTIITGDLGVSPGTSCTGFPAPCTGGPGVVIGTIYTGAGSLAGPAQSAALVAYNDLVAEPCGTKLTGLILGTSPGAVTLSPGVYCFPATAQLTGTLTLSGSGVYVFQIGSTLTTASDSSVVLANGATAANVFWQVGSSATLGTDTVFVGSILAKASDTVTTGTSVTGRVFALTGAVTLDDNVITVAAPPLGNRARTSRPAAGSSPGHPAARRTLALKLDASAPKTKTARWVGRSFTMTKAST